MVAVGWILSFVFLGLGDVAPIDDLKHSVILLLAGVLIVAIRKGQQMQG
jgi:hypothetical protein